MIVCRSAVSALVKVRSIVEVVPVDVLGRVPRLGGLTSIRLSVSSRHWTMCLPPAFVGRLSSQRLEWASKSPPMMKLFWGQENRSVRSWWVVSSPWGQ